jgi:hypothetical protein
MRLKHSKRTGEWHTKNVPAKRIVSRVRGCDVKTHTGEDDIIIWTPEEPDSECKLCPDCARTYAEYLLKWG